MEVKSPAIMRSNSNVLSICVLLLIVLFFYLDRLIGARGLETLYGDVGLLASALLFGSLFVFLYHRKILRLKLSLGIGFVLFSAIFCVFSPFWFLLPFGVIILQPVVLIAGFILLIALIFPKQSKRYLPGAARLQSIILALWLFTIICAFAIAFVYAPSPSLPDSAQLNGQLYYLIGNYEGMLQQANKMMLYECNQFGLLCRLVYTDNWRGRYYLDIRLIANTDANSVEIWIEDSLLYSHYRQS